MTPRALTPIPTPTPIPALAPVDSPLEDVAEDVGEEVAEPACPPRVGEEFDAVFVSEDGELVALETPVLVLIVEVEDTSSTPVGIEAVNRIEVVGV
jgi:hypothetical protein